MCIWIPLNTCVYIDIKLWVSCSYRPPPPKEKRKTRKKRVFLGFPVAPVPSKTDAPTYESSHRLTSEKCTYLVICDFSYRSLLSNHSQNPIRVIAKNTIFRCVSCSVSLKTNSPPLHINLFASKREPCPSRMCLSVGFGSFRRINGSRLAPPSSWGKSMLHLAGSTRPLET